MLLLDWRFSLLADQCCVGAFIASAGAKSDPSWLLDAAALSYEYLVLYLRLL